jgi:Chaperone of endosialidase
MPADDLILNVRQIEDYPDGGTALSSDAVLIQRGGLGGPYFSLDAQDFVSTALSGGGPLSVGVPAPANSGPDGIFANWFSMASNGTLVWNAYGYAPNLWATYAPAQSAAFHFSTELNGFVFYWSPPQAAGAPITWQRLGNLSTLGELSVIGQVNVGRDPTAANELVTLNYLGAVLATSVRSFNMRFGDVMLTVDDIICAGGAPIFSPYFQGSPRASTPPLTSNSSRLATTAFVQMALAAHGDITGYAPIDSPNFTGVPTAPTAALGSSDGQIATTAFVQNAVTESTTGVASFNTRTGAVVLNSSDLTAAGGALLASPVFTGNPAAPTRLAGDSSGAIATTAFVMNAVATVDAGVESFNSRTGAVILTSADVGAVGVSGFNGRTGSVNLIGNDVSAAGGALTVSPSFTGVPSAPTAVPATNTTQLATTAFVQAAIAAGAAGVQTFNGRAGTVTLNTGDVSGAGGALLASPIFTGSPQAPTAIPATATTQLATCAFVMAAIAAIGAGVVSFNARTGAVALIANDISGAGGALLASPVFTGNPQAPTAAPGTSTAQLATTAFVVAAIGASGYLPLTGGTLTGPLTGTLGEFKNGQVIIDGVGAAAYTAAIGGNAANLILNRSGTANNAQVVGAVNGLGRWSIGLGNSTTESGSNVGSDFQITNFNDAGVSVSQPFTIKRSNNLVSVNGVGAAASNVTYVAGSAVLALNKAASGEGAAIFGQTGGANRWQFLLGNGNAEAGSNTGSDFNLIAFNDAGTPLFPTCLTIQRATQVMQLNAVNSSLWPGTGAVGDCSFMLNKAASGQQSRIFGLNNGVFRWTMILGDLTAEGGSNAGSNFQINAFSDAGTGLTPAPLVIARATSQATFGVAIVNGPSDRSLKENIEPIDGALDKVCALQGVSFNLRATPDKPEIGLIAQDVEPIVPEIMQTFVTTDKEGRMARSLLALDYPKLTALLIEAVKTLTARVAALEGAAS